MSTSTRTLRQIRREMKKKGLTIDDMPDDVAESYLVLHQHELDLIAEQRLSKQKEDDDEERILDPGRIW